MKLRSVIPKRKMNKKGVMGIIFFFILILSTLVIAFAMTMVIAMLGVASDEITDVVAEIGVVNYSDTSSTNISDVGGWVVNPMNSIVQALPLLVGFAYVCTLIFSIVFVISYNYNPNPVYIGLYVILIIFMILGTIIMSNSYEQLYERNDELAVRLQNQTILSYMILYSPTILTIIAFITGIYLFAGSRNEERGGGMSI